MNQKRVAPLAILLFVFLLISSVSATSLPTPVSATSFAQLGAIYEATTDDGVNIKLLRYHPPGESCNDAQPVLLFSGIISNMNEYLLHTPPELKDLYDVELPDDIAEWAEGDERIQDDPMLYYSLAYYLWKKGYDVWFANYRGTGYGELKSEKGSNYTTLDTWAIYDVKAAVKKVYEVTGEHPIIGGHSTGGLVSYVYLQGCKFRKVLWDKRVVSDEELVSVRNGDVEGDETVLGFIAIDPAMIPPLPKSLDSFAMWALLDPPFYLDFRRVVDELSKNDELWDTTVLIFDYVSKVLFRLNEEYGKYSEFIRDLMFMNPYNMNNEIEDFLARYIFDSTYTQALCQYFDFGMHNTAREYFEDGPWHKLYVVAPDPRPRDGYYYYIHNMDKVKVPTIAILSEYDALVDADQIIRDLMEAKTFNQYDEWHIIPNTAHVDLPFGLNAPQEVFPLIGDWLEEVFPV